MEWLNYHHLLYFWTVAREGSVSRAADELRLAQPTVSGQIRALEETLGQKLFRRRGRGMELTEAGQSVFRYADQIFTLGRELMDSIKGRPSGRPLRLAVGIADVVPKLITFRLLQPALELSEPVHIVCQEDRIDRLLAALSVHELDLVIADSPFPPNLRVRAYNHLLGECGVTFFGARSLAARYRRGFPRSLDGAPMLMPTVGTWLRRSLDQWFGSINVRPHIVGEVDDSALLKSFGQAGVGLFPGATAIASEIQKQYDVRPIGRSDAVRERYYAITVERQLKHPAVVAISNSARAKLFG